MTRSFASGSHIAQHSTVMILFLKLWYFVHRGFFLWYQFWSLKQYWSWFLSFRGPLKSALKRDASFASQSWPSLHIILRKKKHDLSLAYFKNPSKWDFSLSLFAQGSVFLKKKFKTWVLILKGKVLSLKAVQKSKHSRFPLMKIKVWKANYSEHHSNRANEAISGSEDTKPSVI